MTHYDTLGLTAEAKTDDVRDAYKRLALILHPDRPRGDARAFLELKRAYDCLADGTLRERYDASLASRASRPLADVVDVEEMDVRTVSFGSPENESRVASDGCDVYARACRCGDAYEIPVGELQSLRRTHDECVLECGGCSLRIAVRLAPIGVDPASASASLAVG